MLGGLTKFGVTPVGGGRAPSIACRTKIPSIFVRCRLQEEKFVRFKRSLSILLSLHTQANVIAITMGALERLGLIRVKGHKRWDGEIGNSSV